MVKKEESTDLVFDNDLPEEPSKDEAEKKPVEKERREDDKSVKEVSMEELEQIRFENTVLFSSITIIGVGIVISILKLLLNGFQGGIGLMGPAVMGLGIIGAYQVVRMKYLRNPEEENICTMDFSKYERKVDNNSESQENTQQQIPNRRN